MTRRAVMWAVLRFLVAATVLAVVLALVLPDPSAAVRADLFVLVVGGYGVVEATRWLRSTQTVDSSPVEPLVRRPRGGRSRSSGRPHALRQLVLLVAASARDGHTASVRLRPRFGALAEARAARHRSVGAASLPAVAAVLAGTDDEPVPLDQLADALDALEQL